MQGSPAERVGPHRKVRLTVAMGLFQSHERSSAPLRPLDAGGVLPSKTRVRSSSAGALDRTATSLVPITGKRLGEKAQMMVYAPHADRPTRNVATSMGERAAFVSFGHPTRLAGIFDLTVIAEHAVELAGAQEQNILARSSGFFGCAPDWVDLNQGHCLGR